MVNFARAAAFAVLGFGVFFAFQFVIGSKTDALKAIVAGGIGVAISIAIDLGKQRGLREAEFGPPSEEDHDG